MKTSDKAPPREPSKATISVVGAPPQLKEPVMWKVYRSNGRLALGISTAGKYVVGQGLRLGVSIPPSATQFDDIDAAITDYASQVM